jgi:adenine deaminase
MFSREKSIPATLRFGWICRRIRLLYRQEGNGYRRRFVSPGFIDAHVHIESAMTCITEFVRAVLPRGTNKRLSPIHMR